MKTFYSIISFFLMLLSMTGCADKIGPLPDLPPNEASIRIYLSIQNKEGNDLLQQLELSEYIMEVTSEYQILTVLEGGESIPYIWLTVDEQEGVRYLNLTSAYLDPNVWGKYIQADSGTIGFSIELPSLEPQPGVLNLHLKWNAEYVSEKDREITSYEDATINGQPYEITPEGRIVYVVE